MDSQARNTENHAPCPRPIRRRGPPHIAHLAVALTVALVAIASLSVPVTSMLIAHKGDPPQDAPAAAWRARTGRFLNAAPLGNHDSPTDPPSRRGFELVGGSGGGDRSSAAAAAVAPAPAGSSRPPFGSDFGKMGPAAGSAAVASMGKGTSDPTFGGRFDPKSGVWANDKDVLAKDDWAFSSPKDSHSGTKSSQPSVEDAGSFPVGGRGIAARINQIFRDGPFSREQADGAPQKEGTSGSLLKPGLHSVAQSLEAKARPIDLGAALASRRRSSGGSLALTIVLWVLVGGFLIALVVVSIIYLRRDKRKQPQPGAQMAAVYTTNPKERIGLTSGKPMY
ncbi:hypothetical protein DFJ73DRAFT_324044 [Zopfochytrium polystomum]|nr:hypothetical protein DFJ73DRAFT_324044 [Zopfochytrium polystomum]